MGVVTVAIPTFNGAQWLPRVLAAVASQQLVHDVELLVCDSGSVDGSRELALTAGARLLEIEPGNFAHGRARNLLMKHARGEFVAMISQDAEPASPDWLAQLLQGFELASDVALVYGPYLPRPDCPWRDAAALRRFFSSLAPDGLPRVDRLAPSERFLPARELFGLRSYFTDANGCIWRDAWRRIPYPDVEHAEDHALALRMLRGGYAKVFVPSAGVLHSHHYRLGERLRRGFDDWRAILEVYGWREPATPRHVALQMWGALRQAQRGLESAGVPRARILHELAAAEAEHALFLMGRLLGSRADRLPPRMRRALSLERREGFRPIGCERPEPLKAPGRPVLDSPPRTPSAPDGEESAWR